MPAPAAKTLTKPIQTYLATLAELDRAEARTEGHYRRAFGHLLVEAAGATKSGWTLLDELTLKGEAGAIRWDGVLKDEMGLRRGYWEAKDSADKLDSEIVKKRDKGYSLSNSIFEDTRTAVLFQNGREVLRADLRQPAQIADLLIQFFSYTEPDIEQFEQAVEEFKQRVPELAQGLLTKIAEGHQKNKRFQAAYADLMRLCRSALDPNITRETVDEMLTQHLLTERLIRTIFDNPDFRTQNVIANEIEKVIGALVSASFSREEYLKGLNRFYAAIEGAAATLTDFADKQAFLNTVYERFFQGYAVAVADTHGIVYTPQPIVDFMCASIVETLGSEFGRTLGDPDVVILDPCTGTGNFIVNLLRRAQPSQIDGLYRQRLFANEIMLLPYYIAALNIEHAYYELTGRYEPFEGLCFVDTLTLAEGEQMALDLFTEANTERVERQKKAPITVIVGNPPYNVGQKSENDNNKNRRYKIIDEQIKTTYARDSAATLKMQLYDPYVKFFRWAANRLNDRDGIVCYVSNNSFFNAVSFDGFRKHLARDFTHIYHFDFKGNARTSGERRRQEGGNIFGDQIRVGVGITLAVKSAKRETCKVFYHVVGDYWKATDKTAHLASFPSVSQVPWIELTPDNRGNWLIPAGADDFAALLPLGSKATKGKVTGAEVTIFGTYSSGVKTNRDEVVYDFDRDKLTREIQQFIDDYNAEVDRYKRANRPANIDDFVRNVIKWDGTLKDDLKRGHYGKFSEQRIRQALYRPFSSRYLYFDSLLINRVYRQPYFFPTPATEAENRVIVAPGVGNRMQFGCFITNSIVALDFAFEKAQTFPFYVYDEDGTNRRENISDAALKLFQAAHGDGVSKWDIFYYVYAALHDPLWRTTYADALKKDLPRVPVTPPRGTFAAWSAAGRALADLHIGYETIEPYPLGRVEASGVPYTTTVEKMSLSKDRTALTVNESLLLTGIPAAAFDYRLGSRSALEWVIDQYRVTRNKAGDIISDPNRADDPEYIVNLVGRVIAVSLHTQEIIAGL